MTYIYRVHPSRDVPSYEAVGAVAARNHEEAARAVREKYSLPDGWRLILHELPRNLLKRAVELWNNA